MPSRALPLSVVTALATALVGCASGSSPGSIAYYVGAPSKAVKTSCRGEYAVFHKLGEPTLLVAAYAVSEAVQTICEQRHGVRSTPAVTGVRHEEAVVEYIATTPALESCTIASGTEMTRLHSEFTLSCPAKLRTAVRKNG